MENVKSNDFTEKRVKEVQDKQGTFGTPDYEGLKPIIKELQKENYRAVIIAVETKDGQIFNHKSSNSDKLKEELFKFMDK